MTRNGGSPHAEDRLAPGVDSAPGERALVQSARGRIAHRTSASVAHRLQQATRRASDEAGVLSRSEKKKSARVLLTGHNGHLHPAALFRGGGARVSWSCGKQGPRALPWRPANARRLWASWPATPERVREADRPPSLPHSPDSAVIAGVWDGARDTTASPAAYPFLRQPNWAYAYTLGQSSCGWVVCAPNLV